MNYNEIFNVGKPYRVWPYSDGNELIATLAAGRDGALRKSEFYIKSNNSFKILKDFSAGNRFASTTGQPFISKEGYYLVPVWDVDYYHLGNSYGAIYLSADKGNSWRKVYEDRAATYLNHFYQEGSGDIYIGVGFRKKERNNRFSFTPENGFVLRSQDKGLSWEKFLNYEKPAALYSIIKFKNNIVVSTREQKSILVAGSGCNKEIFLDSFTRNLSIIDDKLVISSDSLFLYSSDLKDWKKHFFGIKAVLRYPIKTKKYLIFGAVARYPKAYLLATDMYENYYFDFSECCQGYFSRLTACKDLLYAGSEYDGKFISLSLEDINFKRLKNSIFEKSIAKVSDFCAKEL